MPSTTSYQAVPSDEGSSSAKPASRFTSRKTLFLSGLVFSILAFASYKAFFSWSIQQPSPQLDSPATSTTALEFQTSSSIPPAPSDTPDMQGQGKYSVG
jgi:chitinase